MASKFQAFALFHLLGFAGAACLSSGDQTTINSLFSSGGAGTVVQLCAGTTISVTATITFTANNQELSTSGYPTDDARAIIQPTSGSNVSMLLRGYGFDGLRVKNIQFDGLRPSLGLVEDGGATIELGQASNGIEISNIMSQNSRAWSCLHLIQGGADTPCTNVTISNNKIGPCGNEGHNSAGVPQWADGISFACRDSLIENNYIEGSTDGGIVLFGAPGTTVQGNTIISSTTDSGFGAINMVDYLYDGSYANVVVTNNTIIGQKMFNTGIAIGAFAWSFNDDVFLQGPATVTNNLISGNIPFAIGVNGWTGGLTVTGNDVSGVNSPSSNYSDANLCVTATRDLWKQSSHLAYYPTGLTGTRNLQSGFVVADGNSTNFICTTPSLPTSICYGLNELAAVPNTVLANLHNSIITQYQGDNNIVTYNTSTGDYVAVWSSGHTSTVCESDASACSCNFQGDGNWVTYVSGAPQFATHTENAGKLLTFLNKSPWIQITNSAGALVWDTTDTS
ncbi:hypothetical protein EYB25_009504 [Talaromyces marneffei]|uniref:uncharacterized protein n=1 Tax=Talaromyces marneffei TaxID=37727 RepID=UPI0012AAAC99|nr:uncharacterized protein EYB26_008774 [Talaromyces marneffei]KAE8547711.1 hypothetical protein EYB25_009504 [Talaromyces marneffei]QGA21064.1 hypothetical protein EYB26_008774 [Talaromyces marneffei]